MSPINRFTFPNIPSSISDHLFQDDKTMIVIGVLGKSLTRDCNKMAGFNLMNEYPSLIKTEVKEGNITFYYEKSGNMLFVHFETTFDHAIMQQLLEQTIEKEGHLDRFISFHSYIRTRFARILLFATQVCHCVVMVEPSNVFDASYLSIFKSLKIIREKYVLKFLPKILKNSAASQFFGKEGRLCSPRFLFFFEKPLDDCADDEILKRMEYDVEDDIYKMLRNEFIITNNSSMSLFSIPRNKRFVYFNTDPTIRVDPLKESIEMLVKIIDKSTNKEAEESEDDFWASISPYKGFAKPYKLDTKQDDLFEKKGEDRSFMSLLKDHVEEALQFGFDDSMAKFRGKSHFTAPNIKIWYDSFKILHKIFIENPDNPVFEANDPDYKAYLENFHKIMDVDECFFAECSEHGLELAKLQYNELLPHHYSSLFHEQKLLQAIAVLTKYARGADFDENEEKLRDSCLSIWLNGKQQCEYLSLRGNPCVMGKHSVKDLSEHSSGVVYISTCNCGRGQGRREDPYTVRQANYEFYQTMAKSCPNCNKLEKVDFPVFEPSTTDFKAAEVSIINKNIPSQLLSSGPSNRLSDYTENIMHLSGSQKTQSSHSNISIDSIGEDEENEAKATADNGEPNQTNSSELNAESKTNDEDLEQDGQDEDLLARQVSTTEYLASMVHTKSPEGLLPLFPSWSLICIGASSIYSHNTGIPEHVQSGFLSGANFLLPWDVHIGLESSWAVASYEKSRHHQSRKKTSHNLLSSTNKDLQGKYCNLKIFIGLEYECPRGHRFIMNSPKTVLRGSSEIERDCGNKVVFNDMPIYFSCPCRSSSTKQPNVAQLSRIHIVTPKAPVNILLDPKVKISGHNGNTLYFIPGLPAEVMKLSQSTYWILRFPYVYQGEDGVLPTPTELPAENTAVLMAGMYGIKECE